MTGKFMKNILSKFVKDEKGTALIIVLVFLLLGSITIVPVLDHISTALESGRIYEEDTNELYTADSGIEESLWRIKYDFMGADYDAYDFYNSWPYETDLLNGEIADITIKNVWFPCDYNPAPSPVNARAIIESEKLVVTGTSQGDTSKPYKIKIDFTPDPDDDLKVKSLGVWLPQGFEYTPASCSLYDEDLLAVYRPDQEIYSDAPGGKTVVWEYNLPYPPFTEFPGVNPEETPITLNFEFDYTPLPDDPEQLPLAIAWVTTDMINNDVPVSWDTDTRFYEVYSTAGDTTVQAFTSKCELRQMGDAMSGEYVAIGGSLLSDVSPVDTKRETWQTPSSYNLDTIPEDADVIAAYLYWAGWRNDNAKLSILEDSCTNMDTYWTYGSPTAWGEDSGEYKAHYEGDGEDSRLLTLDSQNLSPYASDSVIAIWEMGSEVGPGTILFSDTGDNDLNNWIVNPPSAWSTTGSGNKYFQGHSTQPDTSNLREMTLDVPVNLDGYDEDDVYISWDMWENNNLDYSDGLDYRFYGNGGWGPWVEAFRDDLTGTESRSLPIPQDYLYSDFKIQFRLIGFDSYYQWPWGWTDKYLYIDNIEITETGDGLSLTDGLDFAFSGDGGSNWSNYETAFRGDLGEDMYDFQIVIPSEYVTSNFRFMFRVVGCGDSGEKVRIDNFKLMKLEIDTEITFKIDGTQVYFDGSNPASGSNPLSAGRKYAMLNEMWGTPEGFSFACTRDVTALVQAFTDEGDPGHYPGNAVYTVDDVDADTDLTVWPYGTSNFAFAGWSLIVVYASPDTAGHYIYIRDDNFAFHDGDPTDGDFLSLDFDTNGIEGGQITGFVVPEPIAGEEIAATITCFVVEGDDFGTSSIEITGQSPPYNSMNLWNTASPYPDVWNGESFPGAYDEGVDIDTFEVRWDDNILMPGDNLLQVDMYSENDAWNLVYFVISIRSETVTGGTSHYVIYG
jgi:Flp pilus assembly pilin Flp